MKHLSLCLFCFNSSLFNYISNLKSGSLYEKIYYQQVTNLHMACKPLFCNVISKNLQ